MTNAKIRMILVISSIFFAVSQPEYQKQNANVSKANNSINTIISETSKALLTGIKNQAKKEQKENKEEERRQKIISQNIKDRSIEVDWAENDSIYKNYVYPLAKIIFAEAGNMGDKHQQYVGYVVMNRVDSKYFPDNIHDVFFSGKAYAETSKERYRAEKYTEQSIKNAKIVINQYFNGTIPVSKAMVYQAEFKQGVNNLKMGNTYFACNKQILEDLKKEKKKNK